MEIKINKEIRQYQENIFFGLSTRQFFCSLLAVAAAVGVYFLLKDPLGEETVSWVCILAAAPVAAMGFFQYNRLTLEQFVWAWFKSSFLYAGPRKFVAENHYFRLLEKIGKEKPAKAKKQKRRKEKKPPEKKEVLPNPSADKSIYKKGGTHI